MKLRRPLSVLSQPALPVIFSVLFGGAAAQADTVPFDDPVESHRDYVHSTTLTTHTDPGGTFDLASRAGENYLRWSTIDPGERGGTVHYVPGFDDGQLTIVPGTYTVSIDLGRAVLDPPRPTFTSFDLQLVTAEGDEIGDAVVVEEYVVPDPGEWSTLTVSYTVESGSPAVGRSLTWRADYQFEHPPETDVLGAVDNVAGNIEPEPDFEPFDPYVVARDPIENHGDYTTSSVSDIATAVRSDEFGLTARAGTHYFNHSSSDKMRDGETTRTDGFASGHQLETGLYLAHIDVGRGIHSPSRDGYSTVDFRLVTLDGREIGEAKIIDDYVPPAEGEWTTVGVAYLIEDDNPYLGEPITWNIRVRQHNPFAGLFGALDNVVVQHLPEIGDVVATEEMSSSGRYDYEAPAIQRDPYGAYGLDATAGLSYIRYSGKFTEARSITTRLAPGFDSGHTVQPGTYTAQIDLGRAGEILGRDGFAAFSFRLLTVAGEEIGTRNIIKPYVAQPGLGHWTTSVISYTVEPDDRAVGETLTWGAWAAFSNSDVHKFGATDNVVVYFQPAGATAESTYADWQTAQFGDETDPAIVEPEAAPTGDGIANLLKYAFGLDALTPAGGADLPQPEIDGSLLKLTYPERRNSDAIYLPEASVDLGAWSGENVEETNRTQADAEFDEVTVRATFSEDTERGFLRVNVRQK